MKKTLRTLFFILIVCLSLPQSANLVGKQETQSYSEKIVIIDKDLINNSNNFEEINLELVSVTPSITRAANIYGKVYTYKNTINSFSNSRRVNTISGCNSWTGTVYKYGSSWKSGSLWYQDYIGTLYWDGLLC